MTSRLKYKQQETKATCEICGTRRVVHLMYSLHASWVVTGHPDIGAFNCDQEVGQHWGCSSEHAIEALKACLDEHMHPLLKQKHEAIRNGN